MRFIFLGAPGSGKGTQASRLESFYGLAHVSTGDMLRAHVAAGDELGIKANVFMEAGKLVPDDVIIDMAFERLDLPDAAKGFILDGFPRTVRQAEALDDFLKDRKKSLDMVISFDISDEEIMKRLTGRRQCRSCNAIYHIVNKTPRKDGVCDRCGELLFQRDDDRPEVISRRLEEFHKMTAPLIDYYIRHGILVSINASEGTNDTMDRLFASVKAKA